MGALEQYAWVGIRETVVPRLARAASGNSGELSGYGPATSLRAQLLVISASGSVPTLDVVIEDSVDLDYQASLTTSLAGADNDVVFTAEAPGTGGNSITVALVDPSAASQALSVGVVGNAITVNLATNSSSAITTTANDVVDAIDDDEDASALVSAALASGNDGTGVVVAMGPTSLAGGTARTWNTIGTFAQKLGTGREVINVTPYKAESGTFQPIFSDTLRVRWTIAGGTPSFSFTVEIIAQGANA